MINPKSGKGKSLKIFYEMVDPVFKDANVDTEVLVTGKFQLQMETIIQFKPNFLNPLNAGVAPKPVD